MYLRREFFNDFDRMLDRVFRNVAPANETPEGGNVARLVPAVESYTADDRIVLRAEMPGVAKDAVEVDVDDGVLTIRGEKRQEREDESRDLLVRETRYGRFERRFTLPEGVDAGTVTASMNDGVLEVSVPLPKKPAPRQIPVQTGSSEKTKAA